MAERIGYGVWSVLAALCGWGTGCGAAAASRDGYAGVCVVYVVLSLGCWFTAGRCAAQAVVGDAERE